MNPIIVFYNFIVRAISPLLVFVAARWRERFYLYLAAVFSVLIAIDAVFLRYTTDLQHGAFDIMMRYRVMVPEPDPEIVIVDIDEANLAAMASEYGRWPWPRQILAEFLEHIETQRPKAVVFDILFSDPDVFNPDSDAYFDAAVSDTDNTYFPLLRLDPASDALSCVAPAMIPGVTPIPGEAREDATIAVVLPYFPSILKGGRLGLHNIYPHSDGVAREYLVYRNDYGWRIPSLPARIMRDLGLKVPDTPSVLLNWRGPAFTYHTVSFAELFNDMLSRDHKRPADEFTGKIVLIGSTAPSLFDIKPTPMTNLHPGVEILATAIDNLKHDDYLRFPHGRYVYPLLAALIVWIIGLSIYRDPEANRIDRVVGTFEFFLLASSYASINLTHTYINLTGPFAIVLAYYALARLYGVATRNVLETSALRESAEHDGELDAFVLLIRAAGADPLSSERIVKLRSSFIKLGASPTSADLIDGRQKGVWSLLEHTLAVSWIFPLHDQDARTRVLGEIELITASAEAILTARDSAGKRSADWYAHEGRITGGQAASAGWTALLAEALMQWQAKITQSDEGNS
jgi:adenylate cyclase